MDSTINLVGTLLIGLVAGAALMWFWERWRAGRPARVAKRALGALKALQELKVGGITAEQAAQAGEFQHLLGEVHQAADKVPPGAAP